MKVLMVCLGNICRSPMAEGILRKKAVEKGLAIEVDSAGTSNYHVGEAPDYRAQEKSIAHEVDISLLKARQFSESDFDSFDRIFVMDSSNYADVLMHARNEDDKSKVDLILNLTQPGSDQPVPDPYFGGAAGFDNVFRLLEEACDRIIEEAEKKM